MKEIYSRTTFLTDWFGRARVAVSMKNSPSKSRFRLVAENVLFSALGPYTPPTERIECAEASHSAPGASLLTERKSMMKLFTPVCARYQSIESSGAGCAVKDISILFAGSFGCASRA